MSEPRVTIDRCVCTAHSFAQLLALAKAQQINCVEALAGATGAGAGCGLCRPYLRRALRTGETCFHEIIVERQADTVATIPPHGTHRLQR